MSLLTDIRETATNSYLEYKTLLIRIGIAVIIGAVILGVVLGLLCNPKQNITNLAEQQKLHDPIKNYESNYEKFNLVDGERKNPTKFLNELTEKTLFINELPKQDKTDHDKKEAQQDVVKDTPSDETTHETPETPEPPTTNHDTEDEDSQEEDSIDEEDATETQEASESDEENEPTDE